jgi:hypothetical protein
MKGSNGRSGFDSLMRKQVALTVSDEKSEEQMAMEISPFSEERKLSYQA